MGRGGSWTGREILFYLIKYRKYMYIYSKVVTLKRNRKICPEVAINEQFLPGKSKLFLNCLKKSNIFENLMKKSKFFKNMPGKIDIFLNLPGKSKFFVKLPKKNQNFSEICLEKSTFC